MVHSFHECDPVRVGVFDKSHGFLIDGECSTFFLLYSQGKYYLFFRTRRIDPDEFLPFIVRCRTICRWPFFPVFLYISCLRSEDGVKVYDGGDIQSPVIAHHFTSAEWSITPKFGRPRHRCWSSFIRPIPSTLSSSFHYRPRQVSKFSSLHLKRFWYRSFDFFSLWKKRKMCL